MKIKATFSVKLPLDLQVNYDVETDEAADEHSRFLLENMTGALMHMAEAAREEVTTDRLVGAIDRLAEAVADTDLEEVAAGLREIIFAGVDPDLLDPEDEDEGTPEEVQVGDTLYDGAPGVVSLDEALDEL